MTDEELYYKLDPDGCWHTVLLGFNPDFSTWEGFGWLWERAIKMDWWIDFKSFILVYDHRTLEVELDFIYPIPFRDALKEYLKGDERNTRS